MRRSVLAIVLAAGVLLAPLVSAQTSAGDKSLAQALFNEGKRLMDAKQFAQACPKFADSQKLDPAVGTLLNLAVCFEKNGQTASAWATYEEAAAAAKGAAQPEREKYARDHAAALAASLAKLTIAVPPESAIEGLTVTRDGQAVPRSGWGLAAPVDPGEHVVGASAPKRKAWSTKVQVTDKGAASVTVPELEKLPEEAPPPPPPPPPTATIATPPTATAPPPPPPSPTVLAVEPPKSGGTQRTWGWIATSAGGIAIAASVVVGFIAKSKFEKANDPSGGSPPPCTNDVCTQEGLDNRHFAQGLAGLGTAMFIGGALFVVGGITLVLTAPSARAPQAPTTGLAVTPGGVLLRGAW